MHFCGSKSPFANYANRADICKRRFYLLVGSDCANLLHVVRDLGKSFGRRHSIQGLVWAAPRIWQAGPPAHTCQELGGRKHIHKVDGNCELFDTPLLAKIPVVAAAADAYLSVSSGRHSDQPMA